MTVLTNLHCVVAIKTTSRNRRYHGRIARRICEEVEGEFGLATNYSLLGDKEFVVTLELSEPVTERQAEQLGRRFVRALRRLSGDPEVGECATDYD